MATPIPAKAVLEFTPRPRTLPVGPRPVVESELERYGEEADAYLLVRPGVTGLWQVAGRNDVDYARRVALDAWYVLHWSFWNDLVVLFMTVPALLSRRGAY